MRAEFCESAYRTGDGFVFVLATAFSEMKNNGKWTGGGKNNNVRHIFCRESMGFVTWQYWNGTCLVVIGDVAIERPDMDSVYAEF